jgi:hypothetical protein
VLPSFVNYPIFLFFLCTVLHKEVSSTPSSPHKETLISFTRSVSAPGGEDEAGKQLIEHHSNAL